MKYRQIPRTDLNVSLIGLGTMTWGQQNTEAEGHQQMDFALEKGINFIDTAEMYPVPPIPETCHETERIIGTWFASRPGARDKVALATKIAGPGPHVTHVRENNRLDRKNLEAALEGSLKRLRTDRIDLYQLHWPDRPAPLFGTRDYSEPKRPPDWVPIEETLAVLRDFRDAGKVRHFGLSNETPWGTMKFLQTAEQNGLPRIVTIQNAYNLLNRCFDGGLSEICYREDVRLLAYSPLGFGKLSGKYRGGARPGGARCSLWERFARYNGPNADAAIEEYCRIAGEAGLDPAQMALAWINGREHVASNLIGATTMEQLKSNIASVEIDLPGEVRKAIDTVHHRYPNPCP